MTAVRGNANQSLYLARILIDAWESAVSADEVADAVLAEAFLPAIREHLIHAYGWFLLETAGLQDWQGSPPRAVAQLPTVAEGKATPGELREFQALEQSGWLAELLADVEVSRATPTSRANLAVAAPGLPSVSDAGHWASELGAVMGRMRDLFDEC